MDLITAEVAAADGADDNDADGNAEGDGSMVGQWERRAEEVEEGRTEGLEKASTCSCSSAPGWSLLY